MKDFRLRKKIKSLTNSFKKKRNFFLYFFLFFCVSFLVTASLFDLLLRKYIYEKRLIDNPISFSLNPYPVLGSKVQKDITAKAAVVMDNDSKVVLYSKNANLLFSMASTTKIMTAIVALEYYDLNEILTIQTDDVEGVNVGFKNGQRLFFKDILYAMLMPSGNDAALALAQNYKGGEKEFVKKMNEKARKLHLDNTNFADAIGLIDSRDYTTPMDLARLSSIALENKIFAQIVATKSKEISDVGGEGKYFLNNLNKLLGVQGVNGIKTGYTTEAGQVLVTSKVQIDSNGEEHVIIFVIMGSEDRFADTEKLLHLVSNNINYLSIHP